MNVKSTLTNIYYYGNLYQVISLVNFKKQVLR